MKNTIMIPLAVAVLATATHAQAKLGLNHPGLGPATTAFPISCY